MLKFFLLLVGLYFCLFPTKVVANMQDTTIYQRVEISPEPPGGLQPFMQWIGRNYRYPQKAIDNGVQGQILMNFVVERDGSIRDIKVVRDIGYGTGAEAVRVMRGAPKWSPGIRNGRPVRVRYTLPIQLRM